MMLVVMLLECNVVLHTRELLGILLNELLHLLQLSVSELRGSSRVIEC